MLRYILILIASVISIVMMKMQAYNVVVADSVTHIPLPGASIYDRHGAAIGVCDDYGVLPKIPSDSYPITIRYLGCNDKTILTASPDTIFLSEDFSLLPEVEVVSRRVLHVLAYVREYSTMTTYTDTVFLFREKMVDYMLPSDDKVKFKGWSTPRVLTCKSYYRFTNQNGLDSVSDASQHHFSWSDWIGLKSRAELPSSLIASEVATDTLRGKYSPTEIWTKDNDEISIEIDVLADTVSRKWFPNLSGFFRNNIDFEKFKVAYRYNNVGEPSVSALDLRNYSCDIESNGRGHDMFRFNRQNEQFFVSTQAEVYILDGEYISVKEAKKWENRKFDINEVGIYESMDAPELSSSIRQLVERVNSVDKDGIRLGAEPDRNLISRHYGRYGRQNFRIGNRVLNILKTVSGISQYKSNKNLDKNWNKFKKDWTQNKNQNKNTSD